MATDASRVDKLLEAILLLLKIKNRSGGGLSEDVLVRAMIRAFKQGKQFIRPRTFGGN